jgi:hypothetical protein
MRHYPQNSPQASARILSLAALADGHLCKVEIDVMDGLAVHEQLGMERAELHGVMHTFCEDLLATSHGHWEDACRIDDRTISEIMSEVDDPALRLKLLQMCAAIVEAGQHVAEGESLVLKAAVEHWGLHRSMLGASIHSGALQTV